MSEQAKQWGRDGMLIKVNGSSVARSFDATYASEIILNAQEARAFRVMVERGWWLHRAPQDGRWYVHKMNWEPLCSTGCAGSGDTQLEAVLNAERRTKGGA